MQFAVGQAWAVRDSTFKLHDIHFRFVRSLFACFMAINLHGALSMNCTELARHA
jgi:hypothetical protein